MVDLSSVIQHQKFFLQVKRHIFLTCGVQTFESLSTCTQATLRSTWTPRGNTTVIVARCKRCETLSINTKHQQLTSKYSLTLCLIFCAITLLLLNFSQNVGHTLPPHRYDGWMIFSHPALLLYITVLLAKDVALNRLFKADVNFV